VLQVEIMGEDTEREKWTNPNLRVCDSDLETIPSATQPSDHGFVRTPGSSPLVELNMLRGGIWEDDAALLVAVVAPSERGQNPREAKKNLPKFRSKSCWNCCTETGISLVY